MVGRLHDGELEPSCDTVQYLEVKTLAKDPHIIPKEPGSASGEPIQDSLTGILQVQVKLTVLSPIGDGGAGTDVSLEGVEAKRDDLDGKLAAPQQLSPRTEEEERTYRSVRGQITRDGSLGTTVAGSRGADDLDQVAAGGLAGLELDGAGGDQGRREQGEGGGTHIWRVFEIGWSSLGLRCLT